MRPMSTCTLPFSSAPAISSLPIALIVLKPGSRWTRHVIAVSQMLWSGLLIHLTGGRIETHFHVFGSLAFWPGIATGALLGDGDHRRRRRRLLSGIFCAANRCTASRYQIEGGEHRAWRLGPV